MIGSAIDTLVVKEVCKSFTHLQVWNFHMKIASFMWSCVNATNVHHLHIWMGWKQPTLMWLNWILRLWRAKNEFMWLVGHGLNPLFYENNLLIIGEKRQRTLNVPFWPCNICNFSLILMPVIKYYSNHDCFLPCQLAIDGWGPPLNDPLKHLWSVILAMDGVIISNLGSLGYYLKFL